MGTSSLSFVIPVLNEQDRLPHLLQDLRQRFPNSQLIVADGGSSDDSVKQAFGLCDQLLLSPPGRATQMNLGAQAATGDYLFFLHADSQLQIEEGELVAALGDKPEWGFCRVRLSGDGLALRIISWFINLRSTLTHVATGDQVLFVRRQLFENSHGFDSIPLMEDVAYCKRLRKIVSPKVFETPVITSSRRWREKGVLRTVLQMWALRFAYFCGVSPQRLWRFYYG